MLDSEAIAVLATFGHPKRRQMLARMAALSQRTLKQAGAVQPVVPTTVRVESGWDRTAPHSAFLNGLRIRDYPLDGQAADLAARERKALAVSVTDAYLAAVLFVCEKPATVLTSDVDDLGRIAGRIGGDITVVRV